MSGPVTNAKGCTVVLVRHGHTALAGTFCGHSDPPLSQQGRGQLPGLLERVADYHFTHVFSSDLQRARQTAEAIAEARQLPVHSKSSLRELAFGEWEGMDWDQIKVRDPQYAQEWVDRYPFVPAPGGENFDDFRLRIRQAMQAVAAETQGGCAAVVTHAGVIETFLGGLVPRAPAPFKCDYTGCRELWCEASQWRVATAITDASDRLRQMSD